MSHQDAVNKLPKGFQVIASTKDLNLQLLKTKIEKFMEYNFTQKLHTQKMECKYLKIFLFNICRIEKKMENLFRKKKIN